MKKDDAIFNDIERQFGEQLRRLIEDTADTCNKGGLRQVDCIMLVGIHLWYQLAQASHAAGLNEHQFINAAALAYQDIARWRKETRKTK